MSYLGMRAVSKVERRALHEPRCLLAGAVRGHERKCEHLLRPAGTAAAGRAAVPRQPAQRPGEVAHAQAQHIISRCSKAVPADSLAEPDTVQYRVFRQLQTMAKAYGGPWEEWDRSGTCFAVEQA